jgi:hypothetical protein
LRLPKPLPPSSLGWRFIQKKEFLAKGAKLSKEDDSIATLTRCYACDLSLRER